MNDLFVAEEARGTGLADALIAACAELARARGVRALSWVNRARQPPRAAGLRSHRSGAVGVGGVRAGGPCAMKVIKPGPDRDVPRGVVGGARSPRPRPARTTSTWASSACPAGARSRPHYHAGCESAVYMLSGRSTSAGASTSSSPCDRRRRPVYVPPRETHVLENLSADEPAEYVVARDAPTEDSVEVPWADEPA